MKTPPAPSEDLLFSPPSQEPAYAKPAGPAGHASSSDSGMSDERNADSVLFKLDTLSAMQAHKRSEGAPQQMARLAAPVPQSEAGSGLIDLQTLGGAPVPAREAGDASGSGSALTSSAVLSQSSLLSSSSVLDAAPGPGATSSPTTAKAPSRTPLVILSILAAVALLAVLGAMFVRG